MEMMILYGAGSTGRVIARTFNKQKIPFVFVDGDRSKWNQEMEGVKVLSPEDAIELYPGATWIASAITPSFHKEISDEIALNGLKTARVLDFLPKRHGLPPENSRLTLEFIGSDGHTDSEIWDQIEFRKNPDTYKQRPASDIGEIYFPSFITHRDDEHFVDCGAADGDTVAAFQKRWGDWFHITAFEPDLGNYAKLRDSIADKRRIDLGWVAVSDLCGMMPFEQFGDYSSHLAPHASQPDTTRVECRTLDGSLRYPPTYIKMDIEGAELQALWGARRILKEHKPVLAVCAYHEASHLWEIPLLIHALQPEYDLFLRRYAEGTFELVWYAVPSDRVNLPDRVR